MPSNTLRATSVAPGGLYSLRDLPDDGAAYLAVDVNGNSTLCWRDQYGLVQFAHPLGSQAIGFRRA